MNNEINEHDEFMRNIPKYMGGTAIFLILYMAIKYLYILAIYLLTDYGNIGVLMLALIFAGIFYIIDKISKF